MADKKISQLTAATTPLAGTEVLPIVQGTTTVKVANNDLRPKQIQSNATSGVLQVTGPAAASTRVMTTPDANFTVARVDAGQTFTGDQTFSGNVTASTFAATGAVSAHTTNGENQIGSSATYGMMLIGKGSTSNVTILASNGSIALQQPTGTYNIEIPNGNVIMGSGQGIDFSATAGTGTSELLADYEEGTWTTTVSASSNWNATPTLSAALYTKVGRLVTIEGKFTGTPTTTGSCNITFSIPFSTAANSSGATGYGVEENSIVGASIMDPTSGGASTMVMYTGSLAGGVSRTVNFSVTYCAA